MKMAKKTYIIQNNDPICFFEEINLMRDQNSCCSSSGQMAFGSDAFVEDVCANVRIHSTQRVIKQVNIRVAITGTCQAERE